MFCVYHIILMHLTAPKRGFYKKGIINWFQSQWCCLCDVIVLTAKGSGTCRVTTIIFTKTSTKTSEKYFFYLYMQRHQTVLFCKQIFIAFTSEAWAVLALSPSCKALGLISVHGQKKGLSLWSLHVRPLCAWLFYWLLQFPLLPKTCM